MTSNLAVSPENSIRSEQTQIVRWFPDTVEAVPAGLTIPLERLAELSAVNSEPAVVRKVVDGAQRFMIRRFKGCPRDAYVEAIQDSCAQALSQWIDAGVGDRYPLHLRASAEQDLVARLHRQRIKQNPQVAIAMTQYLGAKDDLENMHHEWVRAGLTQEDIVEQELSNSDVRQIQSLYRISEEELRSLFKKESWGHYQDLNDILYDDKTIQTLPGIQTALQARLYALMGQLECMCPGLAVHQPRAVAELVEATYRSQIVEETTVEDILGLDLTNDSMLEAGIRSAASELLNSLNGNWTQAS